jgi:hypothetical protein
MSGSVVFRWLLPAALAALLAIPVQTAGAMGMGGGHGGMGGGMGRGGFGGRGMGMRGRPAMSSRFSSSNHFTNRQSFASRNHDFNRFNNRGDRNLDRRDQFRDSHGLPDRGVDRRDAALDRADREGRGDEREGRGDEREGRQDIREGRQDIRQGNVQEGRQDIREGRQDIREGRQDVREAREERFEHGEREFFFRHNFFVGFNFGAFGWWPGWWGWGWGGPWWWGWDGWAYPYAYCDYGYPYGYDYSANYDDPPPSDSQYGSKEYWSDLAMSVQTKLTDDGYYHGQIDGVLGSGSLEAIRQFQADHGLTVSGKIDPKLLDALGIQFNQQASQLSANG